MLLAKMTDKQKDAMRKIGMTEEEIQQVEIDDLRIDRGEKLFELSPEKEKASKQARQADRKPTVYKLDNSGGKRSRKIDNDKRFLINAIQWLLTTDEPQNGDNVNAENVEILNPEREISFTYNEKKYKIVLSCPRS